MKKKLSQELLLEWNYKKNKGLNPDNFSSVSQKIVWWKCSKDHEWQSSIKERTNGNKCPYCSGRIPILGVNDLATLKPELAKEWNYEKNNQLCIDISHVTLGSNKNVWWKCSKGHEWKNQIYKRVKFGSPCPICKGIRLLQGVNDLATTNPELLKDWDYEKNINLKPTEVTRISRKRVFWVCNNCGHKWSIPIFSRAINGSGCLECSKKIRGESKHQTSLKHNGYLIDKELLQDWDKEANLPLTPKDYTPVSNKYAYWKCHKCGYQWKAKVSNRVKGRGCPCCSNKTVVKGINDLATTHPEIAKEWHPTKNGSLTPEMVSYGYGKKVYWLCPKGHEYQVTPNHRTGKDGTNCPICNVGRQSSFAEQALYYYIKKEFPDALNRYKPIFLERMELDIYIPSRKTAIEYDGAAWHKKDRLANEQKKYRICKERGILLFRIREKISELGSDISDWEMSYGLKTFEPKYLNEAILDMLCHLTLKFRVSFDVNVVRDEQKILEYSSELKKSNFELEFPELAKEWHPTKNGNLKPNMFKPYSDHKVWWICKECGKEYKTSIGKRSYGSACPDCGMRKAHEKKRISVEMIDPETNKIIKTFDSIIEASKSTGINHRNISTVCKGNSARVKAGGYKWRYKN